ncbi:MAG: sulfurtransferase TusA family protein [Bacillota bacterium]
MKLLSVLGEVCPVPLLRTQEALAAMDPGEVLVVETDFARSVRNIIDWCRARGMAYTVEECGSGIWRVTIRKG